MVPYQSPFVSVVPKPPCKSLVSRRCRFNAVIPIKRLSHLLYHASGRPTRRLNLTKVILCPPEKKSKRKRPAKPTSNCPPSTRMPAGLISGPPPFKWLFPATPTQNPSAPSPLSPTTSTPCAIGCSNVASKPSPWSPPASIGFPSSKSSKPPGWKSVWSMPPLQKSPRPQNRHQ